MKHPLILCLTLTLASCGGPGSGSTGDADAEGDVTSEADTVEEEPEPVAPPSFTFTHEPNALSDLARDAIALAPDWLQDDLMISLGRMYVTEQNELASLLLDIDDPRIIDEVAFTIAHMSPEVAGYSMFFSEAYVVNARLIYEHDPLLDYVEIVDVGVPGVDPDFYTTATYLIETESGAVEERTIDPEIYYWYVVQPRLEDEVPLYVDGWSSGGGTRPDLGWFWREFLWDAAAEGCPTERTCPLLRDTLSGIEVFRMSDPSAYDADAYGKVREFVEEVLDFGAGDERPVQPNRIYVLSCGNCGEYADFFVASARTALIPARNVGASSNDHTWGEWWFEGEGWKGDTWFYSGGVRRDLLDNDCDGAADDELDDTDGDGDGLSVAGGDCNDTLDTVFPGATEVQNGFDDDCDGLADTGFVDAELDGDADGWSISTGDCDDTTADVHPTASEMTNGIDDDCDTIADDGTDTSDTDLDGVTIAAGDCNDTLDTIFPGATEVSNGRDDDCDGTADEGLPGSDRDGDGWTMAEGDCNDLNPGINPDAQDPFLSSNRLYAITAARGDSHLMTDRTFAYVTLPSYLEFDIADLDGNPVDGALVTIYGTWEVYGHPESWAVASEVITDLSGHASLTVGEFNPYGYAVTSAIGDTPGGDYLFVAVDRTDPHETYVIEANVPSTMPAPPEATETDLTGGADPEVVLDISFLVETHRLIGDGRLFGSFSLEQDGGMLDAYLLDDENYSKYLSEESFEALTVDTATSDSTSTHDLPRTKSWTLLLSNTGHTGSTMVGSVTLSTSPHGTIRWTEDVPDVDTRFRIPPGEHLCITLTP